ncbi:c-type cytochrome [Calidithermus roseus]|uniref:Cytochrome C oxidase, cbb3-type, subunit III n=1 Tax=Calidithermus roseus TaxID=1644118 RepID=A0A399EX02_9DEIN|nr:c-type cytochrome [Calidithermus roseus]RIH88548.1 Cytochrome C oxidase, cbb3-type, subunit III [Calidithermus roseus]
MLRIALALALLGLCLALAHGGHAHFGVFPGWYSQAQAQRGRSLALQQCAACHGPKLEGRYGPPLAGPRFLARWGGRSAEELGRYIATRMPLGRAGSLESKQVLELIAYILQANGYPAGPKDLDSKSLRQIQFLTPDSKK